VNVGGSSRPRSAYSPECQVLTLATTSPAGNHDDAQRRARTSGWHSRCGGGRTTTYGFVVRNFANPFFLEVLSGAQQVAGPAT
jgi:hypothetical protein